MAIEDAAEQYAREQLQQEEERALSVPIAIEDERKRLALDDVPVAMKRAKIQDTPVGVQQLPMITMLSVLISEKDHWMNQGELQSMSRLLGRKVTGVRVHSRARKRFMITRDRSIITGCPPCSTRQILT